MPITVIAGFAQRAAAAPSLCRFPILRSSRPDFSAYPSSRVIHTRCGLHARHVAVVVVQ